MPIEEALSNPVSTVPVVIDDEQRPPEIEPAGEEKSPVQSDLPTVAEILNNNSAAADHMVHPNRSDDGERAFSGDGYANDIDTNAV